MRRPVLFGSSLLTLAACGTYDSATEAGYYGSDASTSAGWTGTDATSDDTETTEPTTDTGLVAECDDATPVSLWLSPDDSNSMSAPVLARDQVLGFGLGFVPARTWEFLNYYDFDYPSAAHGQVLPQLELVALDTPGDYALQIGIASEHVPASERAPLNLTFVLDTSGSMGGAPLRAMKDSLEVIASELRAGDIVSLVTWEERQNVLLSGRAVSGPNDGPLLAAIDSLEAFGGTNLSAGLEKGYELAAENRSPGLVNRLVLISDGGANIGQTDADLIGAHAEDADSDGIYLVGVGVGDGASYNDQLMDVVTDLGKGAALFIPARAEAERVFAGDRFVNTFDVAARNVHINLDLPAGFEVVRFSGEELSTNPAEIEPQHIAPNDAMVLYQTLHPCAPDAVTAETPLGLLVTWQDAITFEDRELRIDTTFGALLAGNHALLDKGAAVYTYAEVFGDARASKPSVNAALAAVSAAEASNPGDADLAEIRTVLEAL